MHKQLRYYFIKIFLDEAIRENLKQQLRKNHELETETIDDLLSIRDRMYYEVYI